MKYELRILDYEGELLKVYSSQEWVSLKYDRVVNEIGAFACVFAGQEVAWLTENLMLPTALDYFVEIWRKNSLTGVREIEDTYFLRMVNPFEDESGSWFVIGGLSLNHLLLRRVIDPNDDSRAVGGFITEAGVSSTLIHDLVKEHLGDNASAPRAVPNFTQESDGTGLDAGGRWRYDSLLEVLQDLAVKGQVQFRITRTDGNNLLFSVGSLSTDRTTTANYPGGDYLSLNREVGNLVDPSLVLDYQEQLNYIYARGEGNVDNETILALQGDGVTHSPYNRIEFSKGIGRENGDNALSLLTSAVAELQDNQPLIELTFPVNEVAGFRYKQNWNLGDLVTVSWASHEDDLRISAIEVDVQDDEDTINITVEKV